MEIIREIENYQKMDRPLYLALGNFDGVHSGHQRLIETALSRAHAAGGRAAAFIFEPHPITVLFPERAPKMLTSAEVKADLLEKMGLDLLIYNTFTVSISRWTPEEFVKKILVEQLAAKEIFVGFNHSFGHKGAGTPEILVDLGVQYGFRANITPPVTCAGQVVSSSSIRQALEMGDVDQAFHMLGYHPLVEGEVISGEQRDTGFPTANLGVASEMIIPARGVYAAWALIAGVPHKAVVNIGHKPTFHEEYPITIEAHLLEFARDIYGQRLRLHFVKRLRDEKKFPGLEQLMKQIKADKQQAEEVLSNTAVKLIK